MSHCRSVATLGQMVATGVAVILGFAAFAGSDSPDPGEHAFALNVRDFGAKGDGTTDDTLAIQRAADEAVGYSDFTILRSRYIPRGRDGTNAEIYFPAGTYRITGPVRFLHSVSLRGEKGSLIRNDLPDEASFFFSVAERVHVEDLAFEGGSVHLAHWTRNFDTANFLVDRCTFRKATTRAIWSHSYRYAEGTKKHEEDGNKVKQGDMVPAYEESRLPDGRWKLVLRDLDSLASWANSTLIVISNCRFEDNAGCIRAHSDGTNVRNCTFRVPRHAVGPVISSNGAHHLRRLDMFIERNPDAEQYALEVMGAENTVVTGCRIRSDGDLTAVRCLQHPCTRYWAGRVCLEDVRLDTGKAPLISFGRGCIPNMLTIRKITDISERRRKGGKPLLAFDEIPTDENMLAELNVQCDTKRSVWAMPFIGLERSHGFAISETDDSFDVNLPPAMRRHLRKAVDAEWLCSRKERYDYTPIGGCTFANREIGVRTLKDADGRDDTAALRALLAEAEAAGGGVVVLPPKWLRITDTLTVPDRVTLHGCGRTCIWMADDGKPTFRIPDGREVLFRNILFHCGKNAVELTGSSGRTRFYHCFWYNQLEHAILAESAKVPSRQRIELSGGCANFPFLYSGNATVLFDCFWYETAPDRPPEVVNPSYAAIRNLPGGHLMMYDLLGVPVYFEWPGREKVFGPIAELDRNQIGEYRWVDNYGRFEAWEMRFGGEFGGLNSVYHFGKDAFTLIEGGCNASTCNRLAARYADLVVDSRSAKAKLVEATCFDFDGRPCRRVVLKRNKGFEAILGHEQNSFPYESER